MKKYFYFLAIAVLFAACQNKQNEELGTPFQKGQKVTLSATIANPDGSAKQMPGKQRVSGLDDTPSDPTNGAIKLTWNEGDQIKVTVNGQSATFTLKEGYGGSSTGEFEGFMPAEGTTYTVDYPVTAPNLANQKYVANGFGDELMSMHAENGNLNGFTLEAQNALLGLQLTGSKALSDIVVTNSETGDTYTLDCKGVTLKSEATLFYIVVPAVEWKQGFKVEVLQDDNSLISDFEKTSPATFTPNQAMVMPTKVADYELKTLTFEDWTNPADKSFEAYTLDYTDTYGDSYEIEQWSDLIDPDQGGMYTGLIYPDQMMSGIYFEFDPTDWDRTAPKYFWYDENNTKLSHACSYFGFGGMAISNFAEEEGYSQDYNYQLTAYAPTASNFCMVHTGGSSWGGDSDPETFENYFTFGDGIARVIDHMYVANCVLPIGELDYDPTGRLTITAKGIIIDEYDEETVSAELEFTLIENGEPIIEDWTKWNLSKLGKVNKVRFICNPSGEYGFDNLSAPQFAFDDVAVRFPKE